MFDVLGDLNWLAILVATIASAALGAFYFLVVVPRYYVIALGRENEPKPDDTLLAGLGPVVCTLVTTVTSAILLEALGVTSIGDALVFGAIVGAGYLTAMTFNIAINPNFPRPLYYGVLNAPFFIISALGTSVILTAL